ncbi:MAG: N-methyl-L-tryptophan oxidase [Chloroflexota bacterium]
MTTKNDFEYIVIGLGGIGSAAAYWLARRAGREVLALEQFELGHDKGASEDHSRVIRLSYHRPDYVALSRHAFAAWRDLEEDTGEPLLVTTGDLILGPRTSPMPVTDYSDSMTSAQVPFDALDAREIMYRWPQFHLDDDVHGTFQAQGGIVPARKGMLEHARMAREHGATLLENCAVTAIEPLAQGVEVTTPGGTYRCRHLVMATDAWTNRLLAPLGITLPLVMTQEQVSYFASPHLDDFVPDRFPVWIWADDPNFYGMPVFGEAHGIKAAQDSAGREVTLETRTFEADPATVERVGAFLQRTLPRAHGPVLYSKTCIYTLTPDRDFVIDTLPAYPQISLALGSGHAYKFAGLMGHILSDLAIDGATAYDIGPFAFSRPILHMENPPRNFLLRQGVHAGASTSRTGT